MHIYFLILVFQYKFLSYWHTSEGCIYIPDDRHIVDEASLQSHKGFWKTLFIITKPLDRCSRVTQLCVIQVFLIRCKICSYWDQVCNFQNYLHPCLLYVNTFLHQECQSLEFLPIFVLCSTDMNLWSNVLLLFLFCIILLVVIVMSVCLLLQRDNGRYHSSLGSSFLNKLCIS